MKTADCPIEQEIENRIDAARRRLAEDPTRPNAAALMAAVARRTPAMRQRMEDELRRRIEASR